MRRACIDIGSNTTRLLVADCRDSRLREVHQERVFTRIGAELRAGGTIGPAKLDEVAAVVAAQLGSALALGAVDVRCVATASVRRASNGEELVARVGAACRGLRVEVLSGEEEARLAFLGAAAGGVPGMGADAVSGALGVADVGGGSSELVVGVPPDRVSWWRSFPFGSGDLLVGCLPADPPAAADFAVARERLAAGLGAVQPPPVAHAVAVGGSATSLMRLAGPVLDTAALARSLEVVANAPAAVVAAQTGLELERVRLLPAGLLILEAVVERFGVPLHIGRGGIREGVLLEGYWRAQPDERKV